jgi:lysophospholipase L1-like esterase
MNIHLPPLLLAAALLAGAGSARAADALEPLAAFGKETRILFQGDSITDGNRGRSADPNHILGHGYAFIIAAKFGAGYAERNLTFLNRGNSGNTVLDLEKRWQKDTLDLKPGLLSVLIGVNDNSKGVSVEQYEQVYDQLLTAAKAAHPKLKLVLCEPFGMALGAKKAIFATWNPSLQQRQAVVARLAAKHGAALVRFQKIFDDACQRAPAEHWIWDGVHPTYSGHQLMADEWVRTVNAFWPAAK